MWILEEGLPACVVDQSTDKTVALIVLIFVNLGLQVLPIWIDVQRIGDWLPRRLLKKVSIKLANRMSCHVFLERTGTQLVVAQLTRPKVNWSQ